MKPSHDLAAFMAACKACKNVSVLKRPETEAAEHFGLKTTTEILRFIGEGGLEKLKFERTAPWEKGSVPGLWVDSYEFYAEEKPGYLAFVFRPPNRWILKSFHSEASPTQFRNFPFANLIKQLKEKL